MKNAMVLLVHLLGRLAILLGTGGTRAVLAENILLKQQLLVLQRSRRRAPSLAHRRPLALRVLFTVPEPSSADRRGYNPQARYPAAVSSLGSRIANIDSSTPRGSSASPGPKGPAPDRAICEFKANHLSNIASGSRQGVVRRVLAAHYRPERRENEPSWLTLRVIPKTVSGAWTCFGPNRSGCAVTGFWSSWISLRARSSAWGCRPRGVFWIVDAFGLQVVQTLLQRGARAPRAIRRHARGESGRPNTSGSQP